MINVLLRALSYTILHFIIEIQRLDVNNYIEGELWETVHSAHHQVGTLDVWSKKSFDK